jgi:hypothetical protein
MDSITQEQTLIVYIYGVITNDVNDYISLLVRVAHMIRNHPLYVSRKERGRWLMQIEGTYIAEITKVVECVESNEDTLIQVVRTHQHHRSSTLLGTVKNFK